MGFLKKLFGQKSPPPAITPPQAAKPPADPSKDPNMVRVFDAYGRELYITKQQWRDSVLTGHLKKVWNTPDDLYPTIVQALQDGFSAEMIGPAEQLAKIDPNAERGAVVLAIVYRENQRITEAENVLLRFMQRHGETGAALTNLAKVQSSKGDEALSRQTLWHALEVDPNLDNGLLWYAAIFKEQDGPAGELAAFQRAAALPASWRARLWLARDALVRRQLEEALRLYDEAFAMAPRPVPTDMLQQVSGDLGNHAHLPEILRLVAPHFDVARHGLTVGNNLIKASLDLGQIDAAAALVDAHFKQRRMDWKEPLEYWDNEVAKARASTANSQLGGKNQIILLGFPAPLWLPSNSPGSELIPAEPGAAIRVTILGSSMRTSSQSDKAAHQLSDTQGRLSRALPFYLAERLQLGGVASTRVLTLWLTGESPAFAVSGGDGWSDENAVGYSRLSEPVDYVVTLHLDTTGPSWRIDLRLVRTIDGKCLGTAAASFPSEAPSPALPELAIELEKLLMAHAEAPVPRLPPLYNVPSGADFARYLLVLEQLLAIRSQQSQIKSGNFLYGDRNTIMGMIELCLQHPANLPARLILIESLRIMRQLRPEIAEEFREKILLLQREKPFSTTIQGVLQQQVAALYP